jgi:putative cell wall-binding protein
LGTLLAAAMVLGLVPAVPAAIAAPSEEWVIKWDRWVGVEVDEPVSVAVADDGSYYVAGDTLAKYSANGDLLWRLNPGSYWEGTSPASVACDDDAVYLTLAAGWLMKFNATNGSYIWDKVVPDWAPTYSTATPKVEVYEGVAYVTLDVSGSVAKMDSADGDHLGTVRLGDIDPSSEFQGIEVDDNGVYVSYDEDGPNYVDHFDHAGVLQWSESLSGSADPALFEGTLFVAYKDFGSTPRVRAVDVSDGVEVADFALPDGYSDYLARSLACDSDGALYAALPDVNIVLKLAQGPVTQTIDNGILKMTVTPTGLPAAYVWNGDEWVYQYYSEDAWGTILWLDGEDYTNGYRGDTDFTPVSNEVEVLDGGERIVTVYDAGDAGVRVTQTFTIMDGDRYVTKDWRIEHLGGEIIQNVRLYHGGDTYFGGEDSASSYYDPTKSMIYVRNNEFTDWGIMGFYANPATPADHYFGGHYSTGNGFAQGNQDLPDTADEAYTDAGYYLQWNKSGWLWSGDPVWHIQAYEIWTPGGALQVLAPGTQNVLAGSTIDLPFTLHNIGSVPQDVTLSVESDDPAWTAEIVGDTTPDVGGLERIPVTVRVTVPEDATTFANITLSADGPETSGSGTTRLIIADLDFTIEPTSAELRTMPGEWKDQYVTITNNSDDPLKLGRISFSDPDHFGNGEGEGNFAEVGPGESREFWVAFGADEVGTYPCTVSFPITSPVLVTATVSLTGICAYPDPAVSFDPDAVEFSTLTGEWGWQDVTITNDSEYPVDLGTLSVPDPFVLGEHAADGGTLGSGDSTTVPVGLYSDTSGEYAGTLAVPVTGPVAKDFTLTLFGRARLAEAAPVAVDGADRYATAIAASTEAFPDGAPAVVIATGEQFPDALGGSALAGVLDSPILLTRPEMLIEPVRAEIDRLGAERVYVLGGERALTTPVFQALAEMLGEQNVTRIGGTDRYETANLVAAEVVRLQGDAFDGRAFVATGAEFADALAASPIAAAMGWPVYLAQHPVISDDTIAAMQAAGVDDVVLLGGDAAMPAGTEVSILGVGITASRIDGADRYETAAAAAEYGVDVAGMSFDGMGIARGDSFADALVGGAALGRHGSVMLLVEKSTLPAPTESALAAQAGTVESVRFFGGLEAITQAVRDAVLALL